MNKIFKLLIIGATSSTVVGCTGMLETSQNLRESLNKALGYSDSNNSSTISETPAQLCQSYKNNSVKAKMFLDKTISFQGKALSISDAGYALVNFKVQGAEIFYIMKNLSDASNVIKGKTYQAIGEIRDIGLSTTDLKAKCRITVMGESLK